ncbi:hypothetical protein DEU35_3267 [Microbacterium sp. AG157]|uniref:hypothetical protein n=1 Tax=Microbacterium sp. AG157 TaxID=2183993 RepID=UPI000E233225|nr:hypothetical protein [Microbacterium sp. AG157]REC96787.1 hypothetical protein DEU35_3267 [Microbacterium sp. AG157]
MTTSRLSTIATRVRNADDRDALALALDEADEALGLVLTLGYSAPTLALAGLAFDDANKFADLAPHARADAARRFAVLLDVIDELTR